jgi:lipid-A-disaccharide synthase
LKYYIIAGEASGDLHASNLMKAILQKDHNSEFRFWGGDLMEKVANQKP